MSLRKDSWQYGTVVESAIGGRYFLIERDYKVGDDQDVQTWKAMPLNHEDSWHGRVMRLTKVPGDNWKIVWQPPESFAPTGLRSLLGTAKPASGVVHKLEPDLLPDPFDTAHDVK